MINATMIEGFDAFTRNLIMRVVAVQLNVQWEDKAANCERVKSLLSEAGVKPGDLVVLPEMFATGFSMNVALTSEGRDRPTERYLSQLAQEMQVAFVAGVVSDAKEGKGFNEAVVIGPVGVLARYQKIQPFVPGKEAAYYEAGDAVVSFVWQGATVVPFVCYDLRFPEVIRRAAKLGAEVICVISSWPAARTHHWLRLLQARAIENQAFVVGVNRCGDDPCFHYKGRSVIVDQHGEILADAGETEGVIHAELNLEELRSYREKLPFLKDMKFEMKP